MRPARSGKGTRLDLRLRLLILFSLIALPLVYDRSREIIKHRADLISLARERLGELAMNATQRQSDVVSDAKALLTVTAEMPSSAPNSGTACEEPFRRTAAAIPWLVNLNVFSVRGDLICSSVVGAKGINVADRAYFKAAATLHEFVVSDYLVGRIERIPGVFAAIPRMSGEEVESVVVARIDLDWLGRLVAKIGERAGAQVLLIDSQDTVVAAYPDNDAWKGRSVSDLRLAPRGDGRGTRIVEQKRADGADWIYASVDLVDTNARLIVAASRHDILAGVDAEIWLSVLKLCAALILCIAGLWVGASRVIIGPLERLTKASLQVGSGDLDARVPEGGLTPEIDEVARAFNLMAERLAAREAELRAVNEHLALLATVDPLTGLANRRLFDERLVQEWRRHARTERPLGLVVIDVDCFKAFNDTYGHLAGDECLRRVAHALSHGRRMEDLAARTGGEEFAVLMPGADRHRVMHVARLIRLEIEQLGIPHARNPIGVVTVSAGVAALKPSIGASSEILLKMADDALYKAKRSGRNMVVGASEGAEALAS